MRYLRLVLALFSALPLALVGASALAAGTAPPLAASAPPDILHQRVEVPAMMSVRPDVEMVHYHHGHGGSHGFHNDHHGSHGGVYHAYRSHHGYHHRYSSYGGAYLASTSRICRWGLYACDQGGWYPVGSPCYCFAGFYGVTSLY